MARAPNSTPKPARAKAEPAPTTPDPIEIAMEAEASGVAPEGVAARLLAKQEKLVGWQIASERAGFALKVLTALAGLAAAAALGAMAWSASRAEGLVVEAFLVPPDLAARGATGEVVARTVLDRLGELDRGANALESVRVSEAWTQDTKILVPQTGVSLGEVRRVLVQWLGNETHLTGEVMQTDSGVRLTARSGVGRTVSAEGPAEALPELARQVAEGLFAQARPIQYGEYLYQQRRPAEARPHLLRALAASRDPEDRAAAERLLGQVAADAYRFEEALARFMRAAETPNPLEASLALNYAIGAVDALGRDPTPLVRRALAKLRGVRGPVADWYRIGLEANVAADAFDLQAAARRLRPLVGRTNPGSRSTYRNFYASLLARLHEPSAAYRLRQSVDPTVDFYAENWPGFLAVAQAQRAKGDASPRIMASEGLALAQLGRPVEALKALEGAPAACTFCHGARGVALSRLGDVAGSDRAFAEMTRLTPSNMTGFIFWGRERLLRGDAQGALEIFRRVQTKAPRFADGWSWAGEALLATGDANAAEVAFAKGAPFAPRWGRLHLKWGEALEKLGKVDEARAKWSAAAKMDLTAEERARLELLQKRTT